MLASSPGSLLKKQGGGRTVDSFLSNITRLSPYPILSREPGNKDIQCQPRFLIAKLSSSHVHIAVWVIPRPALSLSHPFSSWRTHVLQTLLHCAVWRNQNSTTEVNRLSNRFIVERLLVTANTVEPLLEDTFEIRTACLITESSLGPRPKTNPSADRFQYRALYWKRYMRRMRSGTRLDWVPILNYIQFSPRTKDTSLIRTMILVPRMSILEGYVPMYTQPFTMCLVSGQAHPPTVDDTTLISGRCGSLIVQVYI